MSKPIWGKHEQRRLARQRLEIATRVAKFDKLTTGELRAKLAGHPTPWERAALRYVLAGRADA